jgi:predicted nucleic acid-binding protein
MKAFLDSNIFLNPLLAESECHDCLRVLDGWRNCGQIDEVVTSYLSMANIAYILRKRTGKEKVAPTVRSLLNYVSSISNSIGAEYEYACAMRGPDFEDILQFVNATISGCDILITCNKHGFQKIADPDNVLGTHGPEIITPAEFITRYL